MSKKNVVRVAKKQLVSLSRQVAKMDANSACPLICFQPKLPEAVKKLRKF